MLWCMELARLVGCDRALHRYLMLALRSYAHTYTQLVPSRTIF